MSYLDHVTNSSRFIDHTLKGWIADIDVSQREKFINALYSIIEQTNVHTLQEMDEKWLECTLIILSSINSLDEETQKFITEFVSLLMKNVKKSMGKFGEIWVVMA